MKRHPKISPRTAEHLGHCRKRVSESQLRTWYTELEIFFFTEHRIIAKDFFIGDNGDRIFNLDESGFPLAGGNKLKIVAEKGAKNVYSVSTENKESITVLVCSSADGNSQKPYVIFPGIRQPNYHFKDVDPSKYNVSQTPNGWISSEAFFGFLELFYEAIKDSVQFPVVIFMDNHSSHINPAVVEYCIDHKIILFCFPPHASHIIQPLDISVFGPLKRSWNAAINDFKVKYNQAMSQTMFFTVFDKAWESCKGMKQNIISGFRKAGLVPLNPDALDYSHIIDEQKAKDLVTQSDDLSADQKLGIMRSLKCFKEHLPEFTIRNFETRFCEGYDVDEESAEATIYKIYKSIKLLFKENPQSGNQENPRALANSAPTINLSNDSPTVASVSEIASRPYASFGTSAEPSMPIPQTATLESDTDVVQTVSIDQSAGIEIVDDVSPSNCSYQVVTTLSDAGSSRPKVKRSNV